MTESQNLKIKMKLEEKLKSYTSQTTQGLQKEYAKTHQLHQKTKPENHGD
jgi:hypothetical protein